MSKLQLTFACGPYDRTLALRDGTVAPEGIELKSDVPGVGEIFWAQPASEPWDVCEMSLTGYLWAIQHGRRIENRDVRIGADLQPSLLAHRRHAGLEPLSGHECHLADGIHQGQHVA